MALFAPRVFVAPEQVVRLLGADVFQALSRGRQIRREGETVVVGPGRGLDRFGIGDVDAAQLPAVRVKIGFRRPRLEPICQP